MIQCELSCIFQGLVRRVYELDRASIAQFDEGGENENGNAPFHHT